MSDVPPPASSVPPDGAGAGVVVQAQLQSVDRDELPRNAVIIAHVPKDTDRMQASALREYLADFFERDVIVLPETVTITECASDYKHAVVDGEVAHLIATEPCEQ